MCVLGLKFEAGQKGSSSLRKDAPSRLTNAAMEHKKGVRCQPWENDFFLPQIVLFFHRLPPHGTSQYILNETNSVGSESDMFCIRKHPTFGNVTTNWWGRRFVAGFYRKLCLLIIHSDSGGADWTKATCRCLAQKRRIEYFSCWRRHSRASFLSLFACVTHKNDKINYFCRPLCVRRGGWANSSRSANNNNNNERVPKKGSQLKNP